MLYAGTYNVVQDDQHTESNSGAEIWRSPDGNDWEQVFKAAAKEYGYILA